MAGERSEILTFLYKIIDDTQATIRFVDTKAAAGVAILGVVIGKALDPDQLRAYSSHGWFVLSIAIVFGVAICLSALLAYKIVFPMVNPSENVSFPDDLAPQFFISKYERSSFWRRISSRKRFATLGITHAKYCAALADVPPETLESVVAAEVLKLSFIRQIKIDRLSAFGKILVLTVILFIILMFAAPKPSVPQANTPTPISADTFIPDL